MRSETQPVCQNGLFLAGLLAILLLHAAMQVFAAAKDSIIEDEIAWLSAGLSHYVTGGFSLAKVNPPLPRVIATAPLCAISELPDGWRFPVSETSRLDHLVGRKLIIEWGPKSLLYLFWARVASIVFTVVGAVYSFRLSFDLYGWSGGIAGLSLWCFSPLVLAHGHLVTPDVASGATGLAACYYFWKWLSKATGVCAHSGPSVTLAAFNAGIALGIAELSKTTWIILFVVWPAIALANWARACRTLRASGMRLCGNLTLIISLGILLLNLGYGFEGCFKRLGEFNFSSKPLTEMTPEGKLENRFEGTVLAKIPVPLPANYVQGIDMQKCGFEQDLPMYLLGEWRNGGWWYYYLVGIATKVPIGTLLLAALGGASFWKIQCSDEERIALYTVLIPACIILVLLSSQTAINRHTRYLLPCLPALHLLAAKCFCRFPFDHATILNRVLRLCLAWNLVSSLWIFPHSSGYFNAIASGPFGGPKVLLGSSVDWGQDLLYLKRWHERNPSNAPLYIEFGMSRLDPSFLGIDYEPVPREIFTDDQGCIEFKPGWYVVAVKKVRGQQTHYRYFSEFEPIEYIGYSMYVYNLTENETARLSGRCFNVERIGRLGTRKE